MQWLRPQVAQVQAGMDLAQATESFFTPGENGKLLSTTTAGLPELKKWKKNKKKIIIDAAQIVRYSEAYEKHLDHPPVPRDY